MCINSDSGNIVSELLLSNKDVSHGQKGKSWCLNIIADRHILIISVGNGVLMSIKYHIKDLCDSKTFILKQKFKVI